MARKHEIYTPLVPSPTAANLREFGRFLRAQSPKTWEEFGDMTVAAFNLAGLSARKFHEDVGVAATAPALWMGGKVVPNRLLWPEIENWIRAEIAVKIEKLEGSGDA